MNQVDIFNEAKKEHDELVAIVDASGMTGNSRHMHTCKLDDIYHTVSFSFNSKRSMDHHYEKSPRLAKYIGAACKHFLNQIVDMAKVLSEKDVLEKATAAREEAQKILETIPQD